MTKPMSPHTRAQTVGSEVADKFFDRFVQQQLLKTSVEVKAPGEGRVHRAHPKKKARRKISKESRRKNR